MGKSAIPDRWLDYTPIGKRIKGTRFIAFKVPLNKLINQNVVKDHQLDVDSVLEQIPDLGIIIDLTNTYRYYRPKDFTDAGVEYQKLMIPGKQTPSNALAEQFKLLVTNFLNVNCDNDKLIGVHCTHGVNRTGYLICHYLVSQMQVLPVVAIQRFNTARGHQIERANYLSALQQLPEPTKTTTTTPIEQRQHDGTQKRLCGGSDAGSQLNDRQGQRAKRERPDWRSEDWRRSSTTTMATACHGNKHQQQANSDGSGQYGKRRRYDADVDGNNRQASRQFNLPYEYQRGLPSNGQWGYNSHSNYMQHRQGNQQRQRSRSSNNFRRNDNSSQGQHQHNQAAANNWRQTGAVAAPKQPRSQSQMAERPKYNLIYEQPRRGSQQPMPRDERFSWRRQNT